MNKLKVMTIFGTRPEAIKMCPLVLEMRKYPEYLEPVVAVSAQHREMLDQVLSLFGIVPDYDLNIMTAGQTLYDVTCRALMGLKDVLEKAAPDIVLVHGDTTTTFVGALAAFYRQFFVKAYHCNAKSLATLADDVCHLAVAWLSGNHRLHRCEQHYGCIGE